MYLFNVESKKIPLIYNRLIAKDLKNVVKRLICIDGDIPLAREDYLDRLLKTAQDVNKLALMWPGWAPHL